MLKITNPNARDFLENLIRIYEQYLSSDSFSVIVDHPVHKAITEAQNKLTLDKNFRQDFTDDVITIVGLVNDKTKITEDDIQKTTSTVTLQKLSEFNWALASVAFNPTSDKAFLPLPEFSTSVFTASVSNRPESTQTKAPNQAAIITQGDKKRAKEFIESLLTIYNEYAKKFTTKIDKHAIHALMTTVVNELRNDQDNKKDFTSRAKEIYKSVVGSEIKQDEILSHDRNVLENFNKKMANAFKSTKVLSLPAEVSNKCSSSTAVSTATRKPSVSNPATPDGKTASKAEESKKDLRSGYGDIPSFNVTNLGAKEETSIQLPSQTTADKYQIRDAKGEYAEFLPDSGVALQKEILARRLLKCFLSIYDQYLKDENFERKPKNDDEDDEDIYIKMEQARGQLASSDLSWNAESTLKDIYKAIVGKDLQAAQIQKPDKKLLENFNRELCKNAFIITNHKLPLAIPPISTYPPVVPEILLISFINIYNQYLALTSLGLEIIQDHLAHQDMEIVKRIISKKSPTEIEYKKMLRDVYGAVVGKGLTDAQIQKPDASLFNEFNKKLSENAFRKKPHQPLPLPDFEDFNLNVTDNVSISAIVTNSNAASRNSSTISSEQDDPYGDLPPSKTVSAKVKDTPISASAVSAMQAMAAKRQGTKDRGSNSVSSQSPSPVIPASTRKVSESVKQQSQWVKTKPRIEGDDVSTSNTAATEQQPITNSNSVSSTSAPKTDNPSTGERSWSRVNPSTTTRGGNGSILGSETRPGSVSTEGKSQMQTSSAQRPASKETAPKFTDKVAEDLYFLIKSLIERSGTPTILGIAMGTLNELAKNANHPIILQNTSLFSKLNKMANADNQFNISTSAMPEFKIICEQILQVLAPKKDEATIQETSKKADHEYISCDREHLRDLAVYLFKALDVKWPADFAYPAILQGFRDNLTKIGRMGNSQEAVSEYTTLLKSMYKFVLKIELYDLTTVTNATLGKMKEAFMKQVPAVIESLKLEALTSPSAPDSKGTKNVKGNTQSAMASQWSSRTASSTKGMSIEEKLKVKLEKLKELFQNTENKANYYSQVQVFFQWLYQNKQNPTVAQIKQTYFKEAADFTNRNLLLTGDNTFESARQEYLQIFENALKDLKLAEEKAVAESQAPTNS